jgi:hypothetical protein
VPGLRSADGLNLSCSSFHSARKVKTSFLSPKRGQTLIVRSADLAIADLQPRYWSFGKCFLLALPIY